MYNGNTTQCEAIARLEQPTSPSCPSTFRRAHPPAASQSRCIDLSLRGSVRRVVLNPELTISTVHQPYQEPVVCCSPLVYYSPRPRQSNSTTDTQVRCFPKSRVLTKRREVD